MRLVEAASSPLAKRNHKVLSGVFAEFDTKNQNDRIYPRSIYEAALQEIMPKISEGRLLGECDHPADYDEVRLANVSHVIRECSVKGNKVYGSVELLDTPSGKIAQALVEAGIPLGISSRGLGNTRRIAEGTEVTDLKLITWDLVADPSFSGAVLTESKRSTLNSRLDSIERSLPLNESADENQVVRNKINSIRESLDKAPSVTENLVEAIGQMTENVMSVEKKLSESTERNKSLRSNMSKLQDSYNKVVSENSTLKKSYKEELAKLEESYSEELISLRKELAIERRGLSKDTMMPMLEGLSSMKDIEDKLDSLKHLGTRRYGGASLSGIENLTEGSKPTKKSDKLSRIVSSV